jgi:HD-like signal output (HDOD) protein
VLNASVYEFPSGRSVLSEHHSYPCDLVDDLPDVPALPETLLAMELQLRGGSVDLGGVSEIVLGDLGATIQVLRLAGREYETAEWRPVRIEDCISDLGLEACLCAAASAAPVKSARQRAIVETWTHAREIAHCSRLLAEEMPGSINPNRAYIAGLLHVLGSLPKVLGWGRHDLAGDPALSALRMAERWAFPGFLKDFFCETSMPGYGSHWSELMSAAHDLAMDSSARCPLFEAAPMRRLSTRM